MRADPATCLSALELLRALYHRETGIDEWAALTASTPRRTSFLPSSLDESVDEPPPISTPGNGD